MAVENNNQLLNLTLQLTSGINTSNGATAVTHLQAPPVFRVGLFNEK